MSAQRRPEPTGGSVRGAALVAAAIVLGLILIRSGIDTDEALSAGGGAPGRTTTTDATTSTLAARPAGEVLVLVANGSGVNGAAGRLTTTIQEAGYQTATETNAARVPTTTVYFTEGYEREAAALAETLSPDAAPATAAVPSPAPVTDLAGAHVLVVLGPDLAPPA
jgi:hypothetical protein